MLTELKSSIRSVESAYTVMAVGKHVFVIRTPFVIAQVRQLSDKKFSLRPFNILGPLNPYLMQGKYHLHYKMLEDDVIYALKLYSGTKSISVVLK